MARITNQDGSRWYTHKSADGTETERYLSVTTIIDLGVPKPSLIGWAARMAAEFAIDKAKSVQAILRDVKDGLEGDELKEALADQRETAVKMIAAARFKSSSKAALTGSHVHDAIEAYKLQRPYPGVPKAAERWYLPFLQLLKDHTPAFQQTEANVFHRGRRYAGTLDNIGVWPTLANAINPANGLLWFPKRCTKGCGGDENVGHLDGCKGTDKHFAWGHPDGPLLVGDYKTGKGPRKGGVWPETALQLTAYKNSEFIESPEGEIPMPATDGALAIHLQPGFYELVPIVSDQRVFNAFLHAYEVARWQLYGSKEVIGKPLHYGEWKPEEETPAEPVQQEVAV